MERKVLDKNFNDCLNWDTSISVPGLSSDIVLMELCYYINNDYIEKNKAVLTANPNCTECKGTGIRITENGDSIINLFKIYNSRG